MSCGLSFYSVDNLKAQTLDWDSFIERLFVDTETDSSWSNLYDELCALHEHPININSTTTEELVQLPFLTSQQIEELEAYIYLYGPMKTLGELNLIKGLDYDTRQILHFFLYCGDSEKEKNKFPSLNKLLKYGKNELVVRTDDPFMNLPDNYLGSSFYHSLRYKYKYAEKIEAGLVAEKDIGEKGLDSYAFYAGIHGLGKIKHLIIGNYRLGFAQGLVLNTNFNLGKTSLINAYGSYGKGLKVHSSTSEYNYFQGLASTIQLGKWELSTFYSYKYIDTTLKNDSISSLKEDGYHRTELEVSKKGNILSQLVGGNLSYSNPHFHIGFTTVYSIFNKPFLRNTAAYKLYYPVGNSFWNSSIDYSYKNSQLSFSGECAFSAQGGYAIINTLNLRLFENVQLSFLHRYYDKRYNSIYGSAFSEGGNVKNEHGLYVGLTAPLSHQLKASAYVDVFFFPYLKYEVSQKKTNGIDIFTELNYQKSDIFSVNVRYRNKSKQGDFTSNDGKKGIAYTMNQKAKIQLNYGKATSLQGKSVLNYTQINEGNKSTSSGYSFSQSFQYNLVFIPLRFSVNGLYFHTRDYSSRVFCYEQNVLYAYSIPSYYGEGYRFSIVLKYTFNSKMNIQCKYGYTHYLDREGLSHRLAIQMVYKF